MRGSRISEYEEEERRITTRRKYFVLSLCGGTSVLSHTLLPSSWGAGARPACLTEYIGTADNHKGSHIVDRGCESGLVQPILCLLAGSYL